MNPFTPPRAMAEAQWAAQSFVFALLISFIAGLPATAWLFGDGGVFAEFMKASAAAQGLSGDEAATSLAIIEAMMPWMFIFGTLFAIGIYGVLAWAQWRYMTWLIPAVWIAWLGYSLLMQIASPYGQVEHPPVPLWISVCGWAGASLATLIAVSSLHGAIVLRRLRRLP
ncbi:MAG: hypothetical protein K2X61_02955 [Caulobacteraceae bacterium]|nr:hypothetical protein [Caulobacteraceae bacterium]